MNEGDKEFWRSWAAGFLGILIVLLLLANICVQGALGLNFKLIKFCGGSLPFVQQVEKLWNGKYVVLLQNNYELRPSGGFMGSYAVVDFGNGLNVQVKDIYDADGKLPGHVEPPYPVQEAFGQGWWKLRDANWDIEFSEAAKDINWFLEQGGEKNVDGIIAVNLELFKKWLDVLGGVDVLTYGQRVTSKNLYILAQREAEENFVPGSSQKRDFLGAVGTALLERTKNASVPELLKLLKLVWGELRSRQVLLWFRDKDLQAEAVKWKWDGGLGRPPLGAGYLYIVESNLGANKANCCIKRNFELDIKGEEYKLKMVWENKNEFSEKKPPIFWGGDYYNYLRIAVKYPSIQISKDPKIFVDKKKLRRATEKDFVAPNSLRKNISWDIYNVETLGDYQIIGFWVKTVAQKTSEVVVSWEGDKVSGIMMDRQPGMEPVDLKIKFEGKQVFGGRLENRRIFWFN